MNSSIFQRHSLKTRVTLITLAIFLIGFWSLAFYASQMLREDMQHLLGEQQSLSVLSLATEINHELVDRISVLEKVAGRITPSILATPVALQLFLEYRLIIQDPFNAGVAVYGLDGVAIAGIPRLTGEPLIDSGLLAESLRAGKPLIGTPQMSTKMSAPVFGITVPIRDSTGNLIGVLAGSVDLAKPGFLDIVMQSRQGKSGYYLLEDPKTRMVIIGTGKDRVMKPLPPPGVNPLIDRHVAGFDDTSVTINPLGVEVLASARRIPVAGWFLVGALPTAEAFAPIREMQQRMLLATVFLTLLAGVLIWWVLHRQLLPMLLAVRTLGLLSATGQPPNPLPITSADEIGDLIAAFNHLLETVAQRERAHMESESRMATILNTALDAVIGMDAEGRITDWNIRAETVFGWRREEVLGLTLEETIIPEQHRKAHRHGMERFLATQEARILNRRIEITALRRSGEEFPVELAITPLQTGDAYHFTAFIADISERRKAEEKLHLAASVFSHAREGIIITSPDGAIIDVNDAFTRITGYSRDAVLGKNTRLLSSGRQGKEFYAAMWSDLTEKGFWYGEVWNQRKNGEAYAELLTISAVRDVQGITRQYVALFSDITQRKQMEDQVRQLAFYDTLTSLPNRRLLNDRLTQAMAASARSGCYGAVIFLDLDNFKPLNDTYGHAVGDLLLIEAANRLKLCVREMDTVARFGGDEFVIMLSELNADHAESAAQAGRVAEKIRLALAEPYLLTVSNEGIADVAVEHRCTASIGVTLFFNHDASQDDVLKWADTAMYQAKDEGRNSIRFYAERG